MRLMKKLPELFIWINQVYYFTKSLISLHLVIIHPNPHKSGYKLRSSILNFRTAQIVVKFQHYQVQIIESLNTLNNFNSNITTY